MKSNISVRLTTNPIDYVELVESVRSRVSGAVVLFLGTVRDISEGREVAGLTYEAHPSLAEAKIREILAEAMARWGLDNAAVVHRHGELALGDIAVAVVTASMHRAEAFEAAQWIMETIKQVVPIWKKEHERDGNSAWRHPDAATRPDLLIPRKEGT